jgi:lipid II:glycine glycyltransferase (peptidoglycan interpeptide bridge formation enzyme)
MISISNKPPTQPVNDSVQPKLAISQVTEAQWGRWLSDFADANFYQSWAYGAISWGQGQLSHLVLTQRDTPVGIAQVRVVRVPILGAGVAYVRWGPCVHRRASQWSALNFRQCLDSLVTEFGRRRGLVIRMIPNIFEEDPHATEVKSTLREFGFTREDSVAPYRTLRVDLTPDPVLIRKRLDQKWRNQLNGAERNGLQISEGTDDTHYAQFLAMYEEMMARKQFDTTVDPTEFGQIQKRLASSEKMIISICSKEAIPLSALVCTPIGQTGIYLLGATTTDGMKLKSSYLLQWTMMNRLRELGCEQYDLGGINPETNPGVYHFKQGMGGVDSTQLGRFLRPGARLHNLALSAAEWLQRARMRIRQRPKASKPLTPEGNPASPLTS